jgi:diacylglycerol diphosphate phosphatase/phosphatidate phosphatase
MGLFTRRRAADAPVVTATATADPKHHHVHSSTHGARPTFGQWLKYTLLDLITMLVMGMIGLGVSDLTAHKQEIANVFSFMF